MHTQHSEPTFTPIESHYPFEHLLMDLIFYSGVIILTMICHFSKKAWAWVISSKKTKHVECCLKLLVQSISLNPDILHADNGGEFCSELIKALLILWEYTKYVHGRPRHPQSQGVIERFNLRNLNSPNVFVIDKANQKKKVKDTKLSQ